MTSSPDAHAGCLRAETPHGAILFDPRRLTQADARSLDPLAWPQARAEAGRGGRGAVWFMRIEGVDAVLRHYRRGGLVGRVNRDRTRAFREFRLLQTLAQCDLPVPTPLVAGYRRSGPWYRADILIQRIPAARTLAELLPSGFDQPDLWRRVGAMLARFHAAHVWHADLNAHNILVDAAHSPWLIDFDRGEVRGHRSGWPAENLSRLQRSLVKLGAAAHAGWSRAWSELTRSYDDAMRKAA
jgi:3-deoxy-D-manno-octulosonic acid kinase